MSDCQYAAILALLWPCARGKRTNNDHCANSRKRPETASARVRRYLYAFLPRQNGGDLKWCGVSSSVDMQGRTRKASADKNRAISKLFDIRPTQSGEYN